MFAQQRKRKTRNWRVLGILAFASVVIGWFAGLALVYSADLPANLEQYRPMSSTELYDDHGRVIGPSRCNGVSSQPTRATPRCCAMR